MKKITSTRKYLIEAVVLSLLLLSTMAFAETRYKQGESDANKAEAYNTDDRGVVTRNSTGLCWRTGFWTPAMAVYECDPDLVKKPEEKVAAKPVAPAPAPALTEPEKISFSADALFDFDKAVLKPEGKESLDIFASKLRGIKYDLIIAVGYADRIGSEDYNKNLSMRRAEAVKHYLVTSNGISPDRIFTDGKGEANPVTGGSCIGEKKTKGLIDCLAPDRRVEIEVAGTREGH
ncbi:OmpA family protein [Nitrosomonas sp. Nm33]|uniref:OmpA family protein n=1 Tax=Nitrosomonas sp. Nm33 TaxID=133724 RepID=UPI00089A6420|nr:OmpA family protein [Nitrosomonas sp. Nm33]SDZ02207.1 OmpA-OmpF porin, OOP family [Nitrosomonas sp. Nm33]